MLQKIMKHVAQKSFSVSNHAKKNSTFKHTKTFFSSANALLFYGSIHEKCLSTHLMKIGEKKMPTL